MQGQVLLALWWCVARGEYQAANRDAGEGQACASARGCDVSSLLRSYEEHETVKGNLGGELEESEDFNGIERITATCTILGEDHFDVGAIIEYGACSQANGAGVKYVLDPQEVEDFVGEVVTLELMELPRPVSMDLDREMVAEFDDDGIITNCDGHRLYKVHRVVETHEPQFVGAQRVDVAFVDGGRVDVHNVISIRLEYDDAAPTYCDEDCVNNGMWGRVKIFSDVLGSVNDLTINSSYGMSMWSRSDSKVVTVRMGAPTPPRSVGCPWDSEPLIAEERVREQFGIDPLQFMHREYFVPMEWGDCSWGGLGDIGCAYPFRGEPGGCRTWIRDHYPTTRGHEFGHNFGLMHGGVPGIEYGDNSAIMGVDRGWNGYAPGARVQLGWLPPSAILDVRRTVVAEVRSLHLRPDSPAGDYSVLRFECPTSSDDCSSLGIRGGWVTIGYRTPNGYDRGLHAKYQNAIEVQLLRQYTEPRFGKGTDLRATLKEGESHMLADTIVRFCRMDGEVAVVAVIVGGENVADPRCPPTTAPTPSPTFLSLRANEFKKYEGHISGGGDLLVKRATVPEAMDTCRRLQGCRGFTYSAISSDDTATIYFKNKWDISTSDWTSYKHDPKVPTDVLVKIVNSHSGRALYAELNKNWESGVGAGKPAWDVKRDGEWMIMDAGRGTYKIIANYAKRALYAQPGKNWDMGIGAGNPPAFVHADGEWWIRPEGASFRIVNSYSNRVLYAATENNWLDGIGAGYPPDVVHDDGLWEIVEVGMESSEAAINSGFSHGHLPAPGPALLG